MIILRTFNELARERNKITGQKNKTLGFVPTMGALHEGHLALVKQAKKHGDKVMVSIFVNPTQFGPDEDFTKYPRDVDTDIKKLEGLADYVYLPSVKDIYPDGEKITVIAGEAAKGLDGDFRPGHFDGVATVVSILFDQVKPTAAIFGEKDFQQLMVIKEIGEWRLENGEHFPEIIGVPTLRELSGLAMSSRNMYLSEKEKEIAPLLYKTLCDVRDGKTNYKSSIINLQSYGFRVQYIEQRWNRILAAVYLGKTRLIDNVTLN